MFKKPTIYDEKVETITGNGVSFDKEKYEAEGGITRSESHEDFIKHCASMSYRLVDEKIKECFPKIEKIMREHTEMMAEISRLQSALDAEQKNRCCGNCRYSVLLGEPSMGCNGKNRRVITQKNDPACEHWESCRG